MNIGQRIKKRREELGLSQGELATKLGYKSRNAVYQFEQVDNMKLSLVERFADALECTPAYLMGWEEEPPAFANTDADKVVELSMNYTRYGHIIDVLLQLNDSGLDMLSNYADYILQLQKGTD